MELHLIEQNIFLDEKALHIKMYLNLLLCMTQIL